MMLLLQIAVLLVALLSPAAYAMVYHQRSIITSTVLSQAPKSYEQPRRNAFITTSRVLSSFGTMFQSKFAFASEGGSSNSVRIGARKSTSGSQSASTVIYQPLSIDVDGVQVPIAVWRPSISESDVGGKSKNVVYKHRISVSKIGKLLAGWTLPTFVDRNFVLQPTLSNVQEDSSDDISGVNDVPVVVLAHGYLGSRYDLSHLGEALASEGFLVLSPEYPESLAASYDATESTSGIPIDRTMITNQLLKMLTTEWGVKASAYGIVGHSLGCGTVDMTGDTNWTRVCLAGGAPSLRGPKCLFVGSINDGAVSISRAVVSIQQNNFIALDESAVQNQAWGKLPARASLLFGERRNAPNHISFLAEGPNDAMVQFLSPLLPVARAANIPVLDFDKYQVSRDSKETGNVVIPLVVDYMKQMMI